MRFIHNAHTGRYGRDHQRPLAWLEIHRGATRFPLRPVTSPRFLIGAGTNCHLQLGGEFPLLHSLLFQSDGGWWIEAISPEPELHVNGADCRRCRLFDSDLVSVGSVVLCLRTQVSLSDSGMNRQSAQRRRRSSGTRALQFS